ncbi:MAG: dicarboxylate/amino acid:cation symporter [Planctomycetes bacterium]|nr:dicarboxylate/amino acid:cation symporter [Planctomycetota bacterium]
MTTTGTFLRQWRFTLILIGAVAIGAVTGYFLGSRAAALKPFGDILLNLLFTAVVPLIFFSLSAAVAGSSNLKRLGRIAGLMLIIFVITGVISGCLMIFAVKIFDPAKGATFQFAVSEPQQTGRLAEQIVNTFTVPEFQNLLTRRNMLALIVFAILTGLASQAAGEKGKPFREFLVAGSEVMGKLIGLIMLYAPVGLGAYFAYLVGMFGPQLIGTYARAVGLYYPLAILYFVIGFSFYAFVAGGREGVGRFWTYILPASLTAWGTGSSLAALPANLESAKRIGVAEDIREIVLPLGATIHMDGSCLAAILKIAMLFTLFGRDFSGIDVYAKAVGVAILSGTVMSGIPGGGFLGEMLIVTLYGFGPEALPIISMLGTFVDPPATMVNSSGDTAAAMLVNRLVEGKDWLKKTCGI